MDPVKEDLVSIEIALRELPYGVTELAARSRRAIAEAQDETTQNEAYRLYLQLMNISDSLNACL